MVYLPPSLGTLVHSLWASFTVQVVLEIKERGLSGSWNLNLIEQKIREKIHERIGGKGVFEVRIGLYILSLIS